MEMPALLTMCDCTCQQVMGPRLQRVQRQGKDQLLPPLHPVPRAVLGGAAGMAGERKESMASARQRQWLQHNLQLLQQRLHWQQVGFM